MFIKTAATLSFCLFALMASPSCATTPVVGGYSKIQKDDSQVVAAAKFAVEAQSKKSGTAIVLKQVLEAESQVVAGVNYRMKLEVTQSGETKTASVVVWHQAWNKKAPYQLTSWEVK